MQPDESITPLGPYQECLEHSLTLAHLLERVVQFLPIDSEIWHDSGIQLGQFSAWINHAINADATRLEARRQRHTQQQEAA
jgi:hypothetical protein